LWENAPTVAPEALTQQSTDALKARLLELTRHRDSEPVAAKVKFAQRELMPWFQELSRRNPYPQPADQAALAVGIWQPVWSTIPFQDILPGRQREQSYQIFRPDGRYANIARYAPGNELPLLRRLPAMLLAYDLMLVQRYDTQQGSWTIQNVGIQQSLRLGTAPLTGERAQRWFDRVARTRATQPTAGAARFRLPLPKKLTQKATKQLQGASQATPQFEHLYCDREFRLVKTKRDPKQRPSYTIAVRYAEQH
jgi:hypothetical protein